MGAHLMEQLAEDDRRAVLRRARRRHFTRGEVVFHDGDPGDTLHIVASGHFAVRVTTTLGDTALLRVLGAGEHFGELSLLQPVPRTGSVVALDVAETNSLHRDDLDALRAAVPRIDAALTASLVTEVRRLSELLVDALYLPAEQRVWRRLLDLVAMFARSDGRVVVPLTQDDLAQLAGTTRPTANRALRAGEEAGVIRLARGRIEIVDVAEVARRAR
ncbi:MAG TPA: Crp/Fnr family transcriptional regulator [Acidimicrobiales bacterium]|nr:Crp/Fnr family transcriptional regulator [Acidimicrobiales bacterium]